MNTIMTLNNQREKEEYIYIYILIYCSRKRGVKENNVLTWDNGECF